jgi:hypothetical protein
MYIHVYILTQENRPQLKEQCQKPRLLLLCAVTFLSPKVVKPHFIFHFKPDRKFYGNIQKN